MSLLFTKSLGSFWKRGRVEFFYWLHPKRAPRRLGPDGRVLPVSHTGLAALWGLMGLGKALLHNLRYLKMSWQVHVFSSPTWKITLTTFLLPVKNKKHIYTFFLLVTYRVFMLFVSEYQFNILLVGIRAGGNLKGIEKNLQILLDFLT